MKKSTNLLLRIIGVVTLLALSFSGLFGQALQAEAAETTANITITKQVFDNTNPEIKQNTGMTMDLWGAPLDGAEFTVYNVTWRYHTLLGSENEATGKNYTPQEAIDKIASDGRLGETVVQTGVTGSVNAGSGQYTFTGLDKKSGEQDAAYLIVETDTPGRKNDGSLIIEKAQNMVVVFPAFEALVDDNGAVTGYGDDELDDVYLYPKNISYNSGIKELEEAKNDFEVGEAISYSMTIEVPVNIATPDLYEKFSYHDKATDGLSFVRIEGFQVKAGEDWKTIDFDDTNNYTLTVSGTNGLINEATGDNHFDVDFKLDGAITNYGGQTIRILFTMKLNELAAPDKAETNDGTTYLEDREGNIFEKTDDTPDVYTGGRKFIKTDGHTGAALGSATFVLQRTIDSTAAFAQFQTADGTKIETFGTAAAAQIIWGTEADATNFISDAEGKFEVRGLEYSSNAIQYAMKEIVAPDGYALLTEPVKFDVAQHTYNDTTNTEGDRLDSEVEVKNTPKGLLPSTGGIGIYAFLLAGGALITGAATWYKKSKTRN